MTRRSQVIYRTVRRITFVSVRGGGVTGDLMSLAVAAAIRWSQRFSSAPWLTASQISASHLWTSSSERRSTDGWSAKMKREHNWYTHRTAHLANAWTCTHHTLLTMKSTASKCRPYILGVSPGIGSIFTQISCPFLAVSTDLWFISIPVTIPISTNWESKPFYQN